MTVKLYTLPNCNQCTATKKTLQKLGIDFDTVGMEVDDEARETVSNLGYNAAPVVIISREGKVSEHWSGFKPEKIRTLVA